MNMPLDEVMASYHRCRADDSFFDTFYDVFLAKSPEIAKKFEHTDFTHQKLMLRESLLEMLCLEQGMDGAREEIELLGRRHHDLQITSEMYVMWLDSLCEAVEKHDPQCTPQLTQKWRAAMQPGIELMICTSEPPTEG
jgi:hemoglobin-like flavoprotein